MQKIILIITVTALLMSACKKEYVSEKIIKVTVTTRICIGSYAEGRGLDRLGVTVIRDGKDWACLDIGDDSFIKDFHHIEGYEYELLILETPGHHINTYKLIEVLSMTPADFIDDFYHPYGFIEGRFPYPAINRKLILVYNSDTLANKTVNFVSSGYFKPKAILTFENVISSEAKTVLTVDNLIEFRNTDNWDFRLLFEGVYTTESRSIKYSGFIEPFLMILDLKDEQ